MKLTADWIFTDTVQRLFAAFEQSGHQLLFVGGCVRNALMDRAVADLDMSTSATPDDVIDLCKREGLKFIPTGLNHGTITVMIDGQSFEITSFRKDVETHGRRAVVAFSKDINDDALRRDFTMNALYADGSGKVIDPLGGIDDLLAKRVRFIANAQDRIREDYLRILRYFRFHAWYADQDGGMDADAMAAIAENADGLNLISKERIGAEMRKILAAPDPLRTVAAMEQSGVLNQILPGSSARGLGPLTHLETTVPSGPDWQRRLIVLGGEYQAKHLRLSNAEAKRIAAFHTANDRGLSTAATAYFYGADTALDVALVLAASLEAPPPDGLFDDIAKGTQAQFPVRAADLPITLVGKDIGDTLKRLEQAWVASGFALSKDALLADV